MQAAGNPFFCGFVLIFQKKLLAFSNDVKMNMRLVFVLKTIFNIGC